MIAALPMYDRPETAAANNAFWQAIRNALGTGPDTLTRDQDIWKIWQSPDLLLAQTCGMPFRTRLHGHVTLVGTPDYGLPDCPPGYYNSVFVTRSSDKAQQLQDYADQRFAYNEPLSQSGWAAPQNHIAALGFQFGSNLQTGAHRASAIAVAEGRADIAALDALTWQLIRRYDDFSTNLRVIATTRPTPALPYITSLQQDPAPIARAIQLAIRQMSQSDRETLFLNGLVAIPASAYLNIPNPPPPHQHSDKTG